MTGLLRICQRTCDDARGSVPTGTGRTIDRLEWGMTVDTATTVDVLPPGLDLTPAKRRLYETAIELFGRDTYDAVSIRDIATALGQQPSTLYFHVSSKQDLLFDIAAIGHRTHFESLRDAL